MENSDVSIASLIPLREPTFYILLSLTAGSKHGYAILKDVADLSNGTVKLSTGTLYEALARLLDQSLIERADNVELKGNIAASEKDHPGRPRKTYRLSSKGKAVLKLETNRLQALIAAANQRLGSETAG
jgi:DNA-binding PadR family transcriptional regulator